MKYFFVSILYIIYLFCIISPGNAFEVYKFIDARAYSMGNTISVLPGFSNPASCGFNPSRYFSLQYANKYGMKELSSWAGNVNYPNRYLDIGLSVSRFGMKTFHETSVNLNAYKKLSSFICVGVRINYFNLHYSDKNPNKSIVTADLGLLVVPLENLYVSVLVINPMLVNMKVGEIKQKLPSVLSVGMSYKLSESFLLTSEVEKDFVLPVSFKMGLEYKPIDELIIRAGMFTNPITPTFGVGVHILPFKLDVALSRHPVLGFYSCCGLQFDF